MGKIDIVIGLGYGDEGKGRVVDYLARKNPDSIVVRFNGGPQAGHTVIKDGHKHIFASFGAGTLQSASTYWSSYCPFHPMYFLNEMIALDKRGVSLASKYLISKDSPIITDLDVRYNRALELIRADKHGSCGMGIGTTIERHQTCKVFVRDLAFPNIFKEKMRMVENYYNDKLNFGLLRKAFNSLPDNSNRYMEAVRLLRSINTIDESDFFSANKKSDFIFEGAQGIMLDQDYGFFPHVTRSHTTSKNALELIHKYGLSDPIINYVTRWYQTRHGEGPMANDLEIDLQNNEKETNVINEYQGNFKKGMLDIEQLQYALQCDRNYSWEFNSNLIITCMDQLKSRAIPCIMLDGKQVPCTPQLIKDVLEIKEAYTSKSPNSEDDILKV